MSDTDSRDERELWVIYPVTQDEVRAFQAVSNGFAPREACICVSNGFDADRVREALEAGCQTRAQITSWCRA